MSIQQWPKPTRPRERLLDAGAEQLSDIELIAVLLGNGAPGKSALELAQALLTHYQSLRKLLEAPYATLCQQQGMGLAKYSRLKAAVELSRRYLKESISNRSILKNSLEVKQYIQSQLAHHEQEVFAVLFLDTRYHMITFEKLFFGTFNGAIVHNREVVKRALSHNAAAIIIAHNHPSGITTPSELDIVTTESLANALHLVDIQLTDHIIVSHNTTTSFAEHGLLPF